jgi:hypothetical protein
MSGDRSDLEIPDSGLIESGPEAQPVEQAERELSPREIAMARIYEKADAQREAQMEAAEAEVEQLPEHSLERGDFVEDAPAQRQAPPRRQQQDSAQPQLQAVEIDGQTIYATPNQVAELAKMGAIAQREIARFNAQQAQGWQQPAPQYQPPQQPQPQSLVDRERIAQTVKAIQYGDETTAGEALENLVNHVVARQPNAVAIVEQRLNQAAMQVKLHQDTQIISQEYPDIVADKIRARAAAQEVEAIRHWAASTGQQFDDLLVYREAGNRVRAAFGTAPQQSGRRQSYQDGNLVVRRSSAEIEDRKRAAPRTFSQVIDRRSPGPQQSRPPTGSDIVEQMRRQRGQT